MSHENLKRTAADITKLVREKSAEQGGLSGIAYKAGQFVDKTAKGVDRLTTRFNLKSTSLGLLAAAGVFVASHLGITLFSKGGYDAMWFIGDSIMGSKATYWAAAGLTGLYCKHATRDETAFKNPTLNFARNAWLTTAVALGAACVAGAPVVMALGYYTPYLLVLPIAAVGAAIGGRWAATSLNWEGPENAKPKKPGKIAQIAQVASVVSDGVKAAKPLTKAGIAAGLTEIANSLTKDQPKAEPAAKTEAGKPANQNGSGISSFSAGIDVTKKSAGNPFLKK